MNLILYSTPTCPWCKKVKQLLESENVVFDDIDVSADAKRAEEMIALTQQMGVPVLAKGKEFVIGFDEKELRKLISE